MTLIVGIKCSDGVVMGADSVATLGPAILGQPTVTQTAAKLRLVDDAVIVGVSGPLGLAQLFGERIDHAWRKMDLGHAKMTMPDAQRRIRDGLLIDIGPSVTVAKAAGLPAMALTDTLVALPIGGIKGEHGLIYCDNIGTPEAMDDIPFAAIGSGQSLADPFLAFLRRVFWPDKLPTLADGVFAAVWTLQQAIAVTPGGIGGPIQMATLSKKDGKLSAELMPSDVLGEHLENIKRAEQYLAAFATESPSVASDPPSFPHK